ncbi:ATP-binding protein, partial [Candidatus Aerophobetes bacterium]|nr:ATP-binding protein [Candidatus Aerophobetes bacterium]
MFSKVYTSALMGIDAYPVEVEIDIRPGLPNFNIVGLPDTAVKEAKERVTAAIKNSDFNFPQQRITVNLAPADIKKEGTSFDLPIAIGILKATGAIENNEISKFILLGELALDGGIRKVNGALSIALEAKKREKRGILLPYDNAREASVVQDINIFPLESLSQAVQF